MTEKKKPASNFVPPMRRVISGLNWPGEAPVIFEEQISAVYSADVVVLGGAHAGLACALGAAEQGGSVIVVEKRPRDKMTWIGEQIGSFNSKFCTEQGFGGYDLEEIVDAYCGVYNHYVNRALVKQYVYHSGEVLDRYLSFVPEGSDILDPSQCNIHQGPAGTRYPIVRGGVKTWAGTVQFRGKVVDTHGVHYRVGQFSRLPELLHWVLDETVRLGADWRFGHSAEVLTREDGRVTGVIARTPEGKYVKFRAKKGVLISLGNFTDQGYKLGVWAGGHMDNCPFEAYPTQLIFTPSFCFGNAGFINLNQNGVRFHNECAPFSTAPSRQPDGIISFVTDANWLEQVKTGTLIHSSADFGRPEYFAQAREDLAHAVKAGAEGYPVRNLGMSERETSQVYAAWTLEELGGYLGYEGEDLKRFLASIERYNELCRGGRDTDWGKDSICMKAIAEPPFYGGYAVVGKRSYQRTNAFAGEFSGLHTDDHFRVVDEACRPIPGLYAAGECLGYYRSALYYTPCGGNHIGSAMTHGYLIGQALGNETVE